MRLWKFELLNRGTRLYYRGVALSAVGVLLFLAGVLQLSGLADLGAGGLVLAVLSIGGAGTVMVGFAIMTAACCGLDPPENEERAACAQPLEPGVAIKVRCRSCRTLNDERATLCEQCGEGL